jgi:hypothetical protein
VGVASPAAAVARRERLLWLRRCGRGRRRGRGEGGGGEAGGAVRGAVGCGPQRRAAARLAVARDGAVRGASALGVTPCGAVASSGSLQRARRLRAAAWPTAVLCGARLAAVHGSARGGASGGARVHAGMPRRGSREGGGGQVGEGDGEQRGGGGQVSERDDEPPPTRPISPFMAGSTEAAAAHSLPGGADDDEGERRILAPSRR